MKRGNDGPPSFAGSSKRARRPCLAWSVEDVQTWVGGGAAAAATDGPNGCSDDAAAVAARVGAEAVDGAALARLRASDLPRIGLRTADAQRRFLRARDQVHS